MGNKIICKRKQPKHQNFFSTDSITSMLSIPTIRQFPSDHIPESLSGYSVTSEVYSFEDLQDSSINPHVLIQSQLTDSVLEAAALIFEILKRQMRELCADIYAGVLKIPDKLIEKYASYYDIEITSFSDLNALSSIKEVTKKIIGHLVKMLFIHDLVLNYFRERNNDKALELIKQLAVSHGLKGVTSIEFKMMDYIIVHYIMTNEITSIDVANAFVAYLNTFSLLLNHLYEIQSSRFGMLQKLTLEKVNDRYNKPRENFRLMKKWKKIVENLNDQDTYVESLLNNLTYSQKIKNKSSKESLTEDNDSHTRLNLVPQQSSNMLFPMFTIFE